MDIVKKGIIVFISLLPVFMAVSCETGGPGDDGSKDDVPQIVIPDKEGMTVKGIVINSQTREPLSGVMVSDGRLCTLTGDDGIYYLPTDLTTQRCVFVCVPPEFEVPMNSSNCFNAWKSLVTGTVKDVYTVNFSLTPRKEPVGKYQIIFCGDPQIRTTDQSIPSYEYVVQGLAEFSAGAAVPQYMINLGDLVFNEVSIYNTYKRYLSTAAIPSFNLPGNHDHDPEKLTEYDAISEYIKALGPNNYSVNIGDIHYIFLDSVAWGDSDTEDYESGFNEEALEFLENDLKYVSKDTPLFICTHIPMSKTSYNFGQGRYNFDRFNDLIAGYNVHAWYGHYHINYFYSYTAEDIAAGRTKAASFESHIVVRCAGALSVDKELSSDGVPRGFVVTDIDGKNVTWHYKTVGEYENEQLRVYTPDMTGEECVYANVYLWDNKWGDVEWWEDGVKKGNMVKADGTDPMYVILFRENGSVGSTPTENDTRHLFRYTPSKDAVSGEVRVTDRFGTTWVQKVEL